MKINDWFLLLLLFWPLSTIAQMRPPSEWKGYDQVLGVDNDRRQHDFNVAVIQASPMTNVLWPEEQPLYKIQVENTTAQSIHATASIDIIQYGCRGIAGDIWLPEMYKIDKESGPAISLHIEPGGFADVTFRPHIPHPFGGYALVLDIPGHGRRLITSLIRTFASDRHPMQFPHQSLDDLGPEFLDRIGVHAIRMGIGYTPTTSPEYHAQIEALGKRLKEYQKRHITVLLMFGAGDAPMPLGMPRSFLDPGGNMLNTKQDMVWLPQYDTGFQRFVHTLCARFGWPRGPVTAVSLWNEPWEGISISGWQSDMLRYRELYRRMADGVLLARSRDGAQVLVGGGDSHSNAWDKLFADGKMTFLPIFDFCSIHYQGMESPALYPEWINRRSINGRVKIWDTESWVGNTDDRIGLVVATNRSAGYDRSMGIYGGYLHTNGPEDGNRPMQRIRTATGIVEVPRIPESWSAAAAMGAVQHLLGERDFNRLLFTNGLPWIMVFDGYGHNPDDGTVVVCGDIGEAFGFDNVLFRNVYPESELRQQEAIRSRLTDNMSVPAIRDSLKAILHDRRPLRDGRLQLLADPSFRLYDFYGNRRMPAGKSLLIPLAYRGYFLRTDGSPGSMNRLLAALQTAKVRGYEPVEIIARDPLRPVASHPVFDLQLTNVLNEGITANLLVTMGNLSLQFPKRVSISRHATLHIAVRIASGDPRPDNSYPLEVRVDAGNAGLAVHRETMHVNVISHRTIRVDGSLDDWAGALPQPVKAEGTPTLTVTEAAWYPFKHFDKGTAGMAEGYLAYDDQYFYFAAKVADNTPHPGTYRFAHRPDNEFFYPDTSYRMDPDSTFIAVMDDRSADATDPSFVVDPETLRRLGTVVENASVTRAFAMDIDLPDSVVKVSLYLPNIDVWKADIEVTDTKGHTLVKRRVEDLWHGAYESFYLTGRVRIILRAMDWWYTVKLGGVFIDAAPAGSTPGVFAGEDLDTKGNWTGVYGSEGWYIPQKQNRLSIRLPRVEVRHPLVWPDAVRHFSYRKDPVIPDNAGLGYSFDNVLIAFNVIPVGKDGLLANPPGTMPRYTGYKCTDYEYALNKVAARYGGGTEIWRLLVPGMNRKHFFPRQPKSPGEGAVAAGQLAVIHDGNTRITECAIPWSEIPEVKKALDNDRTIKFSFRVNDDGAPEECLELAVGRSVSKKNARAFHPDWKTHWANEVEFSFEK